MPFALLGLITATPVVLPEAPVIAVVSVESFQQEDFRPKGYKPPKGIGKPRRTGPSGGRIA